MSAAVAALRAALGGVVMGGCLYCGADAASDLYVYAKLRHQAMALAMEDKELGNMLGGEPLHAALWHNATVGYSHKGFMAYATFELSGPSSATDVTARGARRPGYRSNLLYNAIGPGEWVLMSCTAMVPGPGGMATPRTLMAPPSQVQREQHGQQQQPQVQQQQGQQQQAHQQP